MRALILALGALLPLIGRAEPLAITFDDLPLNGQLAPGTTRAGIAKDVLRILKQHRVAPTYGFINASKLEGDADAAAALRVWVAGNQRVGNHAYSHLDLHKSTAEAFLRDVAQNEPVLQLLAPGDNSRWFRYPFLHEGDTLDKRRAVRGKLQERGYRIAQVTLDYEDYLWNSAYARCAAKQDAAGIARLRASYMSIAEQYLDANREMAKIVFGREINHVLLLHLGAFSSTVLPDLLDLLRRKGFTFVTLEQAQSDPIYATDPDAASQYGGTLLEQWMDARKLAYPPIAKKPYEELTAICAGNG
jgi:peptidoglycan/xylan/chitin deacetylase (PgdA/CDA1 family)